MTANTVVTALELGAFVGQVVAAIVNRVMASREGVTVAELETATQEAFASWAAAKARHWRVVHQGADET
jgi:hypothetical protein